MGICDGMVNDYKPSLTKSSKAISGEGIGSGTVGAGNGSGWMAGIRR
ncbi:hypothetical protein [Cytobacillus sp. NCCP-133]|nr:hypothetical protein [Cytobacillus sp. NCCP-133]GLB60300.1 hypothetical protein NCCP133_24320 [Cytobacillus sp. NCCP-133]